MYLGINNDTYVTRYLLTRPGSDTMSVQLPLCHVYPCPLLPVCGPWIALDSTIKCHVITCYRVIRSLQLPPTTGLVNEQDCVIRWVYVQVYVCAQVCVYAGQRPVRKTELALNCWGVLDWLWLLQERAVSARRRLCLSLSRGQTELFG